MKKIFLLIIITIFTVKSYAQGYEWAKKLGSSSFEIGYSVAVDDNKNVYTTGLFKGTADFDPGVNVFYLTASTSTYELFISKLDSAGNFIWAKKIALNLNGVVSVQLFLDKTNHLYLSSQFKNTVDFDPNAGISNLTTTGQDAFIVKLDTAGNFHWVKNVLCYAGSQAFSIAVDDAYNVYTTGGIYGSADFNPNAGGHTVLAPNSPNIFILKLDSAGNFIWVKNIQVKVSTLKAGIVIDNSNQLYIASHFKDTIDADPNANVYNIMATPNTNYDMFILKLDSAGNFIWVKNIGGKGDEFVSAIIVDNDKYIYTTGSFKDTVDFDPSNNISTLISTGNANVFISKLDSVGNFIWAKSMGGATLDEGRSVLIGNDNNVYAVGMYSNSADFDPSNNVYNMPPLSYQNIFMMALNPSGDFLWARGLGGSSQEEGIAFALDKDNALYTTGYFVGTVDFNPGTGIANLTSAGGSSLSGRDAFITKYSYCNFTNNFNIAACNQYSWNTQTLSNSGTYKDTLISQMGCDSLVSINLTINSTTFGTDTQTVCKSFLFNGNNITTTGSYKDTLVNTFGCDSMLTMFINIVKPNVAIQQNSTTLSAILFGASYQWVECPSYNFIAGANQQNFMPTQNGSYAVIVNLNGCSDTSNCVSMGSVGLHNIHFTSSLFNVYPNPTKDEITISIEEENNKFFNNASITIKSITGQTVYEAKNINGRKTTINLNQFTKGFYILEIKQNNKVERIKICKE